MNHTNVCVATCDFCAFAAKPGDPRGYTMRLDEVFATVAKLPAGVREVHVVGGLHPDLPWAYFLDMLKGIKAIRPAIHIKAFTAVEVFFFHRLYRKSVEAVLGNCRRPGSTRCRAAAPRSSRSPPGIASSRARPTPTSGST